MIRLFVGTSANNEDLEAEAVLEYSARKHCTMPLSITWMRQSRSGPFSGWRSFTTGRTPFTALRWAVPALCGYEGRAIYTDVDFFFVDDLAKLWAQDIPGVALVRKATGKLTTSCMLFDCAKAKGHVPAIDTLKSMRDAHSTALGYFRARPELFSQFAGNWDSPDGIGKDTGAVHYTRIETQLHLKHAVPRLQAEGRSHWYTGEVFQHANIALQAMFDGLLMEATAAGYGIERYRVTPFDGATRKDFAYKVHGKTVLAS